jgi:predicted aspartyl protease
MPVWVNGIETIGIMDTGAVESMVTPELAAVAALTILKDEERFRGVSGALTSHPAYAEKLQAGSILDADGKILGVYPFAGSHGREIGVLIGADFLDGFDYDMDLSHDALRPYQTHDCQSVDPPWPDAYGGLALKRGALGKEQRGAFTVSTIGSFHQIMMPVAFPGGVLDALFDSGTTQSMLSHAAARDAGATNAELDADPLEVVTGVSGEKASFRTHRFAEVAIGAETLRDMPMHVAMSFDRRDRQMILGMDYIETHHLWLSYTTNALYIDLGSKRKPMTALNPTQPASGALMLEHL